MAFWLHRFPRSSNYVTKKFELTSDAGVMQKNLASLVTEGGGDGPEAQTAALKLDWTNNAVKMLVLITDVPPHGIGKFKDGFDKSPDR